MSRERTANARVLRIHLLALHEDMKQRGHEEYAEHMLYILRTMLPI